VGIRGSVEDVEKACTGRIWCKYFVHMFINGKMRPLETIPRMVGRKNNGEWWNG
jgi:hypothetical protein